MNRRWPKADANTCANRFHATTAAAAAIDAAAADDGNGETADEFRAAGN